LKNQPNRPLDQAPQSELLQVEVQLFAAAADRAGVRQLTVQVPTAASVVELRQRLIQCCPALEALAMHSRWAVDCEFVDIDFVIDGELSIAMIPPVSGG
jgi:molybdopterin converting factor small subunit